jgi:hypothetical protein
MEQLMQLIAQLEDLCEARAAIQEAWREAAASIDIRGALRGSDPTHREALVKVELQKYDAPAAAARESVADQARILQLISEAHTEFLQLKPPQTEVDRLVQEYFDRCSSVRPNIHPLLGHMRRSEQCVGFAGAQGGEPIAQRDRHPDCRA